MKSLTLRKLVKEELEKYRKKIEETKITSISVGDTFTLSGDLGKFKKGEEVKVIAKMPYGDDIKLTISNGEFKDTFHIDKNDDVEAINEMGRKKIYDNPEDRPSFYKKKGTPRGGKEPLPADVKNQYYLFKITTAENETTYRIFNYKMRTPEAVKQQMLSQAKSAQGSASDRKILKSIRNNPDFKVELIVSDPDKEKLQKQAKAIAVEDPDYIGKVNQIGHAGSSSGIKIIPVPKEYVIASKGGEELYVSDVAVLKNKELKDRINTNNYITYKGGKYWKIKKAPHIKLYGDVFATYNKPGEKVTDTETLVIDEKTTIQDIRDFMNKFRK